MITRETNRAKSLNAMNDIMLMVNDQDFMDEWWCNGVPDGADWDEIVEIAEDEEMYVDMVRLFFSIMRHLGMAVEMGETSDVVFYPM